MGKENPYRRALKVLRSVAWVEGLPALFDAGSIQFSPVAAKAWRACVDVVAGLPIADEPMSIQRRLALRFDWTASQIVGDVNGKAIWRWLNPPDAAWVSQGELAELEGAAAMWDLEGNDTADAADETRIRVEPVEHPKIKLPTDPAVAEVLNALQEAKEPKPKIRHVCREIAEKYKLNSESLRTSVNRWRRENNSAET
jgi:hypothetical protein